MHHPQVANYFVLCFALIAMFTLVACAAETAPASLADQAGGQLGEDAGSGSVVTPVATTLPAAAPATTASTKAAGPESSLPSVVDEPEPLPAAHTPTPSPPEGATTGSAGRLSTAPAGTPRFTAAGLECPVATEFDIDLAALPDLTALADPAAPSDPATLSDPAILSDPATSPDAEPTARAVTALAGDELLLAFRCADREASYAALEIWGYTPEEARCTIDEVFASELLTAEVIAVVHQLGANPRELVPEAYLEAESTCLTEERQLALDVEESP
jgi:hypothetical protein